MTFRNNTALDGGRLLRMFLDAVGPRPVDELDLRVRYSRRSDFSGSCHYATNRIHVNLGRHLRFPYRLETYIARTVSLAHAWRKPLYSIELSDAYQLALFLLLHEYYHWLVKRAGRNTRQKESMCDRFAVRELVDRYGTAVRDSDGRPADRSLWDFQALDGFVAAAFTRPAPPPPNVCAPAARSDEPRCEAGQYLLFGS